MRILVTGGAGFIGSHLVDALLKRGHEVSVLDNLVRGKREQVNARATFFEVDLLDARSVERVVALTRPEAIFHLAAHISLRDSVRRPMADAQVNIVGSLNVLHAAQASGTRRIIFSSTGGAMYHDPKKVPTAETEEARPLSPYAVAKLSVENYLEAYYRNFGLEYAALRYANVYGPRQSAEECGVVAIFLEKMLSGENPTIFGTGTQKRDYVYVADVVAANLLALESPHARGVYNIGTGRMTSVLEVFDELNAYFGGRFEPRSEAARAGDMEKSALAYGKAKRELGWEPTTPFETGIEKTAGFFLAEKTERQLSWFHHQNFAPVRRSKPIRVS